MSYLSSYSFSQRWRFRGIRSNILQDIESDIACIKVLGASPNVFYALQVCGHPLSSSRPKE